jgi:hypothetical protein
MWKEYVVAYFRVMLQYAAVGTERKHVKPISGLIFENRASRIRNSCADNSKIPGSVTTVGIKFGENLKTD